MGLTDPLLVAMAPYAALLLGLVVGSFLNVVILRLPRHMRAELAEACAELRSEQAEPVANGTNSRQGARQTAPTIRLGQ